MFNIKKRMLNMVRISAFSTISSVLNIAILFIYRTLFLSILSKEYLGIEGLFSNIIQVLSLSELGVGVIISYKLYEPIKQEDIRTVSSLMEFYRKIYMIIAIVVGTVGLIILPCLRFFIKDANEIPTDINIYCVYILFLLQSISSYLFSYKQTLLVADQRGDELVLFNFIVSIVKLSSQVTVLYITRNYEITLAVAIFLNICFNYLFSLYISKVYWEVFRHKEKIDQSVKMSIFSDMRAVLFHKIGGTVKDSTDNLVLSSFVGLGSLGIYSNYTLIINGIKTIITQFLGNLTASIGNAFISMERERFYHFFEELLIANFVIANISTVCVYALIDPFISVWQGNNMIFSKEVTIAIIVCFFINIVRIINISFTNACGLFNKDIVRPLVEVIINLGLSIFMTFKMGILGIFIGTICSHLCTVWWREPYLLYIHIFKKSMHRYWLLYLRNVVLIIFECFFIEKFITVKVSGILDWIVFALLVFVLALLTNLVMYWQIFKTVWLIFTQKLIRKM